MKNWNILLLLISLLLITIIIGFMGIIFKTDKKEIERGFCGTTSPGNIYSISNDSINFEIGKEVFKEECAFCHNKNMKNDLTGPALGGALKRFDNDTIKFASYLRNQENYLFTENDKRILLMHNEFDNVKKPVYDELTMNEIKSIIEYIETIY